MSRRLPQGNRESADTWMVEDRRDGMAWIEERECKLRRGTVDEFTAEVKTSGSAEILVVEMDDSAACVASGKDDGSEDSRLHLRF